MSLESRSLKRRTRLILSGLVPAPLRQFTLEKQLRPRVAPNPDWTFSEINRTLIDRTECYRYYRWFFLNSLPPAFQAHRRYFASGGRGFGEDAFHAMWFKLFSEFRPRKCLEIGVYRGQTLSYFCLLGTSLGYSVEAWGVSPLDDSADAVSSYVRLDYAADIRSHFEHFNLGTPNLIRATSQDPLLASQLPAGPWDLVYVDGSHDEETVRADVRMARDLLGEAGILVLDDASRNTDFHALPNSFRGHPGPSSVASSPKDMAGFIEIGHCGHNRVFRRL